jgi:hypothetical protein
VAMDNLGGALKQHCRSLHVCGTSNQSSYYFSCWQGMRPQADGPASNAFMTPGCATHLQRRRTLKYRTGSLYCGVVAHRVGKASTPHCALGCVDAPVPPLTQSTPSHDTCHHSVSGCAHPAIRGMVTDRHNAAGLAILRAIRGGSRGACVVAADVGALPPSLSHLPRALPAPLAVHSRPDLVLRVPGSRSRADEYICVELKYCCDYRPAAQLGRAHSQHTALYASLAQAGHKVTPVVIMLGVAGTVFTSLFQDAQAHLGLTHTQARSLGRTLHCLAVRSLSSIYATKRQLERQVAGPAVVPATGLATPLATAGPRAFPGAGPGPRLLRPRAGGKRGFALLGAHARAPSRKRGSARLHACSPPAKRPRDVPVTPPSRLSRSRKRARLVDPP